MIHRDGNSHPYDGSFRNTNLRLCVSSFRLRLAGLRKGISESLNSRETGRRIGVVREQPQESDPGSFVLGQVLNFGIED